MVPEEIQHQYALHSLSKDGWVYIKVRKGRLGLKQAGKVANDCLTKHLSAYMYAPIPRAPALWKHATRPMTFTLCTMISGLNTVAERMPTI